MTDTLTAEQEIEKTYAHLCDMAAQGDVDVAAHAVVAIDALRAEVERLKATVARGDEQLSGAAVDADRERARAETAEWDQRKAEHKAIVKQAKGESAMAPPTDRYRYTFPDAGGETRLRELVLYIAGKCDRDRYFGKTKLNKILLHSDFGSFARRGRPITGVAYMRQKHGPVPQQMLPTLNRMQERGDIYVQLVQVGDRVQQRIIPRRKPDLSLFSSEEIALVDDVIRRCWRDTAVASSLKTHGIAWRIAGRNGTLIPYEAAFLSDEPVTAEDVARVAELNRVYHWEA